MRLILNDLSSIFLDSSLSFLNWSERPKYLRWRNPNLLLVGSRDGRSLPLWWQHESACIFVDGGPSPWNLINNWYLLLTMSSEFHGPESGVISYCICFGTYSCCPPAAWAGANFSHSFSHQLPYRQFITPDANSNFTPKIKLLGNEVGVTICVVRFVSSSWVMLKKIKNC
jgi:hypothetical protein